MPLTIGLSLLVAVLQTRWHRTGDERYLKLTKFYGKLFLINFAMGIVTGIVQEFQFGMNWSGWIFTEMGRQPWIVFGEMLTRDGVSRSVSLAEVTTSFTAFTLAYATLAVIEVRLLIHYVRAGLPDTTPTPPTDHPDTDENRPLAFAY